MKIYCYNANSGYSGYSMSNRAEEAYDYGAKPKSKWTKAEILDEVKRAILEEDKMSEEEVSNLITNLKSLSADTLRRKLLTYDSWHHTGSYFNETQFYTIDPYAAMELNIEQEITDEKAEKERLKQIDTKPKRRKCSVSWKEWEGTRSHPKAIDKHLANVWAEEHGAYTVFYKTWNSKEPIMRKKTSGNYINIYYE